MEERVEGVVKMMLDATSNYDRPLTSERLWNWQAALFPSARNPGRRIIVGGWRDDRIGPMQVISRPLGRERVHFQAPAAGRIEQEFETFLHWFNTPSDTDWVLKAGVAHLWFVTIHPFDDGNGRVARAIADMALARSEESSHRFYSMSSQIRTERSAYYRILEQTQKGTVDITEWMDWFLGCLGRAIDEAENTLETVITKANFWQNLAAVPLNDRQRRILTRLLDGFEGKLTTSKWAKLAKCSQDTALRDITGLIDLGILVRGPAGGRSTSYRLEPTYSMTRGPLSRVPDTGVRSISERSDPNHLFVSGKVPGRGRVGRCAKWCGGVPTSPPQPGERRPVDSTNSPLRMIGTPSRVRLASRRMPSMWPVALVPPPSWGAVLAPKATTTPP